MLIFFYFLFGIDEGVLQGPSINPPAGSQVSTPNSTATNSTVVACM